MKLFFSSIVSVLAMLPVLVFAVCAPSTHFIGLGGDQWWQCWKYEPDGGGVISFFVFHHGADEMSGVQFRVVSGGGFAGQYLGETVLGGISFGNSQDGITIWRLCDGGIYPGETMLMQVQYMTDGTSAPCSYLRVEAHPGVEGQVEPGLLVWDCIHTDECFVANGGVILINPNMGGAHCDIPCSVPVHETTWGQIKELYTE